MTSKRTINVFMLAMMNIAAIVNIANLSISAKYGFSGIFYLIAASIFFFIPVALISAELATGWPDRGVYIWVKEAMGEKLGFLAIWLQWIENVIWYPTALSFLATSIAYIFNPSLAQNKTFITTTIIVVFWLATFANFYGMTISGWVSTICALFGTILPGAIIITLAAVWLFNKNPSLISFTFKDFLPNMSMSQLALLSGFLMSLSGLEMNAVHAKEVKNPKKNYPLSMFFSVFLIITILSLGSLAIAIVIPVQEIELPAGAIEAISSFLSLYKLNAATPFIALFIALGALGMISTWIIGPIKGMYATTDYGEIPPFFHKVNKHSAPTNLLLLQAVMVTILSLIFLYSPTVSSSYWILFNLTAHLYQVMYILMFISAIILRYKKPNVERTYKIPYKNVGIWVIGLFGIFGTLFAMIVGFYPTEHITGLSTILFEVILIGGTILFCAIPFIIHHYKNPLWIKKIEK